MYRFLKSEIIVIHTLGKTASTSLLKSIEITGAKVVQCHWIRRDNILSETIRNLKSPKKAIPLHLLQSIGVRLLKNEQIHYIQVNRKDDARWVSDYLQNLDVYGKIDLKRPNAKDMLRKTITKIDNNVKLWEKTEKIIVRSNFLSKTVLSYEYIDTWTASLGWLPKLNIEHHNNSETKFYNDYKKELINFLNKNDISLR